MKQQETPQKTVSEKKTATRKKAGTMAENGKESQQQKTPSLVEQYKSLKEKNPDAVLLFRKGDFYQTVNEDAKKTSEILGITLTKPNAKAQGEYLAMFPHQALDTYLPKLIRAGARVAIVDDISLNKEQKAGTSPMPMPFSPTRTPRHGTSRQGSTASSSVPWSCTPLTWLPIRKGRFPLSS